MTLLRWPSHLTAKLLASGSRDNTAILWDVSIGAQRHVLQRA